MLHDKNFQIFCLLITILVFTWISNFIFAKQKKNYNDLLNLKDEQIKGIKTKFDRLLSDKRVEALRRKKAEQNVRELNEQVSNLQQALLDSARTTSTPSDNEMALPLNQCRVVLETIGRIGQLRGNLWRKQNIEAYITSSVGLLDDVSDKILELVKGSNPTGYNLDLVNQTTLILDKIANKIVNETAIIPTLVDEMFVVVDNFYKSREQYLLSGGPEPMAVLSAEYRTGTILMGEVKRVLDDIGLSNNQKFMLQLHITQLLTQPLIDTVNKINGGVTDPLLNATGYLVNEFYDGNGKWRGSFYFPCLSRLAIERSRKFDFKPFL